MKPLVSIICITYNQKEFITQALDGFIMQKTNFPFEIIIHDDASTDGTADIIKKYAKKHPDIFKTIYEKENQYSQGGWGFFNDMFYAAKGKYIALCEGDDFWIDANKLQKQVDFLEDNQEYSMCFHSVSIEFEDDKKKNYINPAVDNDLDFSIKSLLENNFINTCSVLYKKQNYQKLPDRIMPYDIYMHLYHAQFGKIGYVKDVMATYRKQPGGVWWESGSHMDKVYLRHRFALNNLFAELLNMFDKDESLKSVIYKHIEYLYDSFIGIDERDHTALFSDTAQDFPALVAKYTVDKKMFAEELITENRRLKKDVEMLLPAARELEIIKKSRWYRLNPNTKTK